MIYNLKIGILRHPKRFILAIIFGFTILWTVVEPIICVIDIQKSEYTCYYIICYIAISLTIALFRIYPKRKVCFALKNTNTKVEIEFGDLFQKSGHKVIPTSEFFDSEIGLPVSKRSLLGIFITSILGGHSTIIDDAVSSQLSSQEIGILRRDAGKDKRYNIGTTVSIKHNDSLYFLFALSNTDEHCTANSTPSSMLTALGGLWNKVRAEGNGVEVNIPLIGHGLSRIGLPPNQLLQLILISLLKSVKENDLSSIIRIILTPDIFDEIDLEIIKNNW
jgi:hypothetical protein